MDCKEGQMDRRERSKGKQNGGQSLFLPSHRTSRACLFLDFALGSHGLHGLLYSFLITKESHRLNRLQVCVQLIHDWDSCGQVELHDCCIRQTYRDEQIDQTDQHADQQTEHLG